MFAGTNTVSISTARVSTRAQAHAHATSTRRRHPATRQRPPRGVSKAPHITRLCVTSSGLGLTRIACTQPISD